MDIIDVKNRFSSMFRAVLSRPSYSHFWIENGYRDTNKRLDGTEKTGG